MSRTTSGKMGLKHKLIIPNILYLILLAVVLFAYFSTSGLVDRLGSEQKAAYQQAAAIRTAAFNVKSYLAGEVTFAKLSEQYTAMLQKLKGSAFDARLNEVGGQLERHNTLSKENAKVAKQITDLTSTSIQQSNGYIKMMVEKLAGEETRAKVSTLERLVIIGANINTTANYELKVRFLRLRDNLAVKDAMLKYLETMQDNVKKDVKRLEGTPFQQMAIAAREANAKITELTKSYISNTEEQQKLQAAIIKSITETLEAFRLEGIKRNEALLGSVQGQFMLVMAVIVVVTIIGIVLSFYLSITTTRSLRSVISGLTDVADRANDASRQVSDSSQSLAETMSQQAASLEETSSSMEEMSSMTRQNAENAGQADSMMKQAGSIVAGANDSMNELKAAMDKINTASDETAKIIKTIDEIAFQTNLLALNAAVEAARAGEAGAGFAVVADEVRNLAMRAAEAAKNTSALIEENIVDIKTGSNVVNTTDQAFSQVQESAAKVAELVGEIAGASSEQAQGIQQINKALTEMDKVTQQNAASAEESAAASEELRGQAAAVRDLITDLRVLVGGAGSADAPAAEAVPKPGAANQRLKLPFKRAKGQKEPGSATKAPEKVIPLDDDDFGDF